MEAGAHLQAERAYAVPDRGRALDRSGGAVEGREKAVSKRLHLAAAEAPELAASEFVMARDQVPPAPVAGLRRAPGRVDDVGEHHGRQDTIEGPSLAGAGEEFLHLVQ